MTGRRFLFEQYSLTSQAGSLAGAAHIAAPSLKYVDSVTPTHRGDARKVVRHHSLCTLPLLPGGCTSSIVKPARRFSRNGFTTIR